MRPFYEVPKKPTYSFIIPLNWQIINRQTIWNFLALCRSRASCYTCDKQVLWESAGAFFFRATTLISRGNSHVSRVRGLVVRCLPFNPEVSCSNPWVCANFFTSIPKQKVLTFFGTMRLFGFVRLFSALWDFFRLCETFFEIFWMSPKSPPFNFFDILQENEC